MSDYLTYRFNKQNLTLLCAYLAAALAYYAWKEARDSAHHSRQTRALIVAAIEAGDGDDTEETDA